MHTPLPTPPAFHILHSALCNVWVRAPRTEHPYPAFHFRAVWNQAEFLIS